MKTALPWATRWARPKKSQGGANNLREVGLDSAALVNRIDNGNCEWSCG
jgi:hypothetical protein